LSVHNIEHISTNEISNTSVNISVIAWILLSTLGNTLLIGGLNILQQPVFEPFSLAITFSLLILWICGHEYSHYLAAKYVGFKQVTFGIIKRKLFYTVATQIPPQIGINHPGKRSVVSVAGMIYDGLFLSTLTLISLLYADAKWVSLINAVLLMGALSLCLNASVMKGSDGSNAVHHLFNLVGKQRNKLLRWTLSAAKTFMLVNTLFLVVYLVLLIIKSDTILIQVQEHWPL
jgi:membrane-associated protease RseP (regulator of RpoE activity)